MSTQEVFLDPEDDDEDLDIEQPRTIDARYIYDPDVDERTIDMDQEDDEVFAPRRRRRKTAKRRKPRRGRLARLRRAPRRAYRYVKKRVRRPKLTINKILGTLSFVGAFLVSLQSDTIAYFGWENVSKAFRLWELQKTLLGGWGRPNLEQYVDNVKNSVFGIPAIVMTAYSFIPYRLPYKRIVRAVGIALLAGSLIGAGFHKSDGNNPSSSNNPNALTANYDPFNGAYA